MNNQQRTNGHFLLGERIGQGSMGHVYRGQDIRTGRDVAIKVLKPERVAADPGLLERLAREGEMLRRLNHPNIVNVLDTLADSGCHCIVMEYVSGGSLRHLLEQKPQLPVERVLALGLEVADALARAHHLQIIHRDLKPANVLLAEDDMPRLTDFGLAQGAGQSRLVQTGTSTGAYAYLSPEVCIGQPPDARTDIWALGVMLYEMLAGRRPFRADHPAEVPLSIISKPVPDLHQTRPDVPPPLVDLIDYMLVKDRDQRLPNARLVGAELEAILRDTPTLTPAGELTFTTPAPFHAPHNLPADPTPFVGRDTELAYVNARLADPDCRLLTIVGPGGMGKTRIALQAARQQLDYVAGGVFFVPLAGVSAPEFLVSAIAEEIGFNFYQADAPNEEIQTPRAQLLNYLKMKEMLLVLDDFEHLLDGAGLISAILNQAPGVELLVTSRERLNLRDEWVFRLQGLDVPPPTALPADRPDAYSAVQLFVQSAQRTRADFSLTDANRPAVSRICRLVEGMPLGLELAAGWMGDLSPAEMGDALAEEMAVLATAARNVPEENRSLHALLKCSWQRLSRPERMVLQQASLFRGGFTRDAATAVAGATLPLLTALVNKSLLRCTRADDGDAIRYELHERLRQFAHARLAQNPEALAQAEQRHCTYYVAFVHERAERLDAPAGDNVAHALEREIENIRAAWQTAVAAAEVTALRQIQLGLGRFYRRRNRPDEGHALFSRAAAHLQNVANADVRLLRAQLLVWQAEFSHNLGQMDAAKRLLNESLAVFRAQQARSDEANALRWLAAVAGGQGQFERARQQYRESLALYQALDDPAGIAWNQLNLGWLETEQGHFKTAQALYESSLAQFRQMEDGRGIAHVLHRLGTAAYRDGDILATERFARESLTLFKALNNQNGEALAIRLLAMAANLRQDYETARQLNLESLALYEKIGNQQGICIILNNLCHVSLMKGNYEAAKSYGLHSLEIYRTLNHRWGLVYPLVNLSQASGKLGEYDEAWTYLQEGLAILRQMDALPLTLETLVNVADIWQATGKCEQALELLAFVDRHPALICETREMLRTIYEPLAESMPHDAVVRAEALAQTLDLDQVLADLLAEP